MAAQKVKAYCLVCAGGGKDLTPYGSKKAANIAAVSHMNQYGHQVVLLDKKPTAVNPRTGHSMRVQSLLFDRHMYTPRQATSWAHAHGFKYGDVEIPEAGRYIHLRQLPPRGRVKRIIPIGSTLSGIRAIVLRNPLCCP